MSDPVLANDNDRDRRRLPAGDPANDLDVTPLGGTTMSLDEMIARIEQMFGISHAELTPNPDARTDFDQVSRHGVPVDPRGVATVEAEHALGISMASGQRTAAATDATSTTSASETIPPLAGRLDPAAVATVEAEHALGLPAATTRREASPEAEASPAVNSVDKPLTAAGTTSPSEPASAVAPGRPSWQESARAYNHRQGLIEQFNAATGNACGVRGDADPDAVAAWQVAHGLSPDGRVGPATLRVALPQPAPRARATEHGAPTTRSPEPASAASVTSASGLPTPVAARVQAANDHRAALAAESARLVKTFKAGQISEGAAVQQFVAFDQRLGGGKMSRPGVELLAQLVTTLGVAAAAAEKHASADRSSAARHASADTAPAAGHAAKDASSAAKHASADTSWTAPGGAKLSDPELLELAARVHDPNLGKLLPNLAGVLELATKLRAKRDDTWEMHGREREQLVRGIGVVRADLAVMNASDPNVQKFKIAVNHKLEEIAPYHFQLNIKSVESVGGWSTCNLTSFAMSLEAVGINAANWNGDRHALAAVASVFKKDIEGDKETKNPGARLASHGRDTANVDSLMGLRLPDFLQLAAIVHALKGQEPTRDNIVTAAAFVVENKKYMSVLAGIAADFGASCSPANVKFDANRETNRAMTNKLSSFGDRHRGDHGKNQKVEHLNTLENLAERESNAAKKAEYGREASKLRESQDDALTGKDDNMEKTLPLETYSAAVTRDLGKYLDEGCGVLAGLSGHWTRVYAIDENGVKVQDPGQWNRSEMFIPWNEARAMGYFWTNWAIK